MRCAFRHFLVFSLNAGVPTTVTTINDTGGRGSGGRYRGQTFVRPGSVRARDFQKHENWQDFLSTKRRSSDSVD